MTVLEDHLALLDELELKGGGHGSFNDGVCAMEAVAWLAGEPHSDHPQCASQVIGAFMRTWNDQLPDDQRQVLKGYLPRLVGTAKGPALEDRLAWMAADWLVREYTPAWLRLAGLEDQALLLEGLSPLSADTVPSIKTTLDAVRAAAGAAAWAAAGDAAWDAAGAAAGAAARAALAPTKEHLQLSALGLLDRMVTAAEEFEAA